MDTKILLTVLSFILILITFLKLCISNNIDDISTLPIIIFMVIISILLIKLKNNKIEFFSHSLASINDKGMSKSYSNRNLVKNRKNNQKWRKPYENKELLINKKIYTPQGLSLSINKNDTIDGPIADYSAPSINGKDDNNISKFLFKYNQCSPHCCPSTYTCDKGCICTTEKQRDFISSRGKINKKKI